MGSLHLGLQGLCGEGAKLVVPQQWWGGPLKEDAAPAGRDTHHPPTEAEAATTATGGYGAEGGSRGLLSLPSGCSEGPWPSLQGRGYILSLHDAQGWMPCTGPRHTM